MKNITLTDEQYQNLADLLYVKYVYKHMDIVKAHDSPEYKEMLEKEAEQIGELLKVFLPSEYALERVERAEKFAEELVEREKARR